MSKRETPLTRRYWKKVGGTLIEEFMAVPLNPDLGRRLIDGVILEGSPTLIAKGKDVNIKDKNII